MYKRYSLLILSLPFLLATSCAENTESVADAGSPAADASPDASPDAAESTNLLGKMCSGGPFDCPADHHCTQIPGVGSADMGWCTPACRNGDEACTQGYTGPEGGVPKCAISSGNTPAIRCMIECEERAHCPEGLDCLPIPPANTRHVCAPPE